MKNITILQKILTGTSLAALMLCAAVSAHAGTPSFTEEEMKAWRSRPADETTPAAINDLRNRSLAAQDASDRAEIAFLDAQEALEAARATGNQALIDGAAKRESEAATARDLAIDAAFQIRQAYAEVPFSDQPNFRSHRKSIDSSLKIHTQCKKGSFGAFFCATRSDLPTSRLLNLDIGQVNRV